MNSSCPPELPQYTSVKDCKRTLVKWLGELRTAEEVTLLFLLLSKWTLALRLLSRPATYTVFTIVAFALPVSIRDSSEQVHKSP